MKVDFRRLTWENYPSTETPINADNLNRLEEGVAGLYSDVAEIEQELGDGVGEYVTDWLNEHVDPVGSAVVVDDTLSIEGAAADAKKTGDEISSLKEDIESLDETIFYEKNNTESVELTDTSYVPANIQIGDTVSIKPSDGGIFSADTFLYTYDAEKKYVANIQIVSGQSEKKYSSGYNVSFLRCSTAPSVPYIVTYGTTTYNENSLEKKVSDNTEGISALDDRVVALENKKIVVPTGNDKALAYAFRKELPQYYFAQKEYPSSYDDNEWLQERINAIPNGKHFIFVTDRHWPNNAKRSTMLIGYLKSKLGIHYVIDGGDTINRNDTAENVDGKYLACKLWQSCINSNYDAWGDGYLPVIGNHDINTANPPSTEEANLAKQRITYDAVADILLSGLTEKAVHYEPSGKLATYLGDDQTDYSELMDYFSLNYYVDDDINQIRYIIYNTGAPYNGVVAKHFDRQSNSESSLILDWLYEVLMSVPTGYDVVVVGHEPTFTSGTILTNTTKPIPQMLNGYKQKASIRVYLNESAAGTGWIPNGNRTYDFTSAPTVGKVLILGGHFHRDYIVICTGITFNDTTATLTTEETATVQQSSGATPVIYTQCDAYSVSTPSGNYHTMTLDTVTEQCLDIITLTDTTIELTRIGAGEDRSIKLT